jgi:hypothetical protein
MHAIYIYCFYCQEEFEDTKVLIRIRISKKNRQNNGQKKKDKQRSTKHTHKTKDRVTRTWTVSIFMPFPGFVCHLSFANRRWFEIMCLHSVVKWYIIKSWCLWVLLCCFSKARWPYDDRVITFFDAFLYFWMVIWDHEVIFCRKVVHHKGLRCANICALNVRTFSILMIFYSFACDHLELEGVRHFNDI